MLNHYIKEITDFLVEELDPDKIIVHDVNDCSRMDDVPYTVFLVVMNYSGNLTFKSIEIANLTSSFWNFQILVIPNEDINCIKKDANPWVDQAFCNGSILYNKQIF